MNQHFTAETMDRVQKITGLSGDQLTFVASAATITAEIGRFPTKVDMYTFIGMSERELDLTMRTCLFEAWTNEKRALKRWFQDAGAYDVPKPKAMIYALATDLVMEGLVEDKGDADGRARGLLKTLVNPQQITTRAQFDGFMVTLEYLWHLDRKLDTSLPQFLKGRYGSLHKNDSLRAFAKTISENDRSSFPDDNYAEVISKIVKLFRVCD